MVTHMCQSHSVQFFLMFFQITKIFVLTNVTPSGMIPFCWAKVTLLVFLVLVWIPEDLVAHTTAQCLIPMLLKPMVSC